jgi:hypothetical protein
VNQQKLTVKTSDGILRVAELTEFAFYKALNLMKVSFDFGID